MVYDSNSWFLERKICIRMLISSANVIDTYVMVWRLMENFLKLVDNELNAIQLYVYL